MSITFMSNCSHIYPPPDFPHRETLLRVDSLLGKGVGCLRKKDLIGAQGYFELAGELAPQDPRVLDAKGCLAVRKKQYDRAKEFFQRAIVLNPHYDRPYVHLAYVAEEEGNIAAALGLYKVALQYNPLNVRARSNLINLLNAKYPNAIREIQLQYKKLRAAKEELRKYGSFEAEIP